jgi:hypothetical protein
MMLTYVRNQLNLLIDDIDNLSCCEDHTNIEAITKDQQINEIVDRIIKILVESEHDES